MRHPPTPRAGIVAILGTTYTGAFYDVEALDRLVSALNEAHGWSLGIHVDAASGGFVAPFAYPDLKWCARACHAARAPACTRAHVPDGVRRRAAGGLALCAHPPAWDAYTPHARTIARHAGCAIRALVRSRPGLPPKPPSMHSGSPRRDFRLPNVVSINASGAPSGPAACCPRTAPPACTSVLPLGAARPPLTSRLARDPACSSPRAPPPQGHKFGLVFPGLGWCMFRSREHLPDSLVGRLAPPPRARSGCRGRRPSRRASRRLCCRRTHGRRLRRRPWVSVTLQTHYCPAAPPHACQRSQRAQQPQPMPVPAPFIPLSRPGCPALSLQIFKDNYLGKEQITFTLNFSKSEQKGCGWSAAAGVGLLYDDVPHAGARSPAACRHTFTSPSPSTPECPRHCFPQSRPGPPTQSMPTISAPARPHLHTRTHTREHPREHAHTQMRALQVR